MHVQINYLTNKYDVKPKFFVADIDYETNLYTVKVPAGVNCTSFDVALPNDTCVENNKAFTLAIVDKFLPYGFTLGSPNTSTVHGKTLMQCFTCTE